MSDGGLVILTFTLGIVVWPAIIAGLCRVLRWSSTDQPSRAWAAPSEEERRALMADQECDDYTCSTCWGGDR